MNIKPFLFSIVLINLFSSSSALAQTTAPQDTTNQQLMLNNAKLSREEIDKKNGAQPVSEMRVLGKPSNVASTPTNLTDQEKVLSENFIHEGKTQQIINEKCAGDMRSACAGNEGKHKFLGMDPAMVKALSQAYAMIMTMAGDSVGGITKSPGAVAAEEKAAQEAVKNTSDKPAAVDKKANDYCKYIPTFTETIATVTQTAKAKELESTTYGTGDNSQKDALLKAAASHDSRAKMAQMQATGWWGGAACYAVNAMRPDGWAVDKSLLLKLGASTLLGAFYQNEVSANKEYAEKTRTIANALPGKGDCNPITDKLCYCSQPSTENDTTYCMPTLHKKALTANAYRVACTDNNLKIDPKCNCETNNSCFDSSLESQSQGTLQLGQAFGTSPFSGVRALARGELVGGTLNNQAYLKTSAIAKKALQELGSKISPSSPASAEQKKLIDAMMSRGIPANVATLMAQNPPSAQETNSAMARFNGASSGKAIAYAPAQGRSNVVEFSGGDGLGVGGNNGKSNGDGDDFLAKLKPGGASKGAMNSKILQFAEKAQNMANQGNQIRKDEGAHLFDIISMRYQTSGRRLLEVDLNNN